MKSYIKVRSSRGHYGGGMGKHESYLLDVYVVSTYIYACMCVCMRVHIIYRVTGILRYKNYGNNTWVLNVIFVNEILITLYKGSERPPRLYIKSTRKIDDLIVFSLCHTTISVSRERVITHKAREV